MSDAIRPASLSRAADPGQQALYAWLAGFLGWALDAFDFFLVVIALPQIADEFHVKHEDIAASITLTLMFRPVGALIFGLLADRYGRRLPMIIDLVFYSVVEVATGFAPNLTTFLILRALFGIGMGGEWGVGASLVMEKVPAKWRGILSGMLQEGYAVGYLLAAVAAYFMLDKFGWRPMFWLGGAPALLALFIRFFVHESEVWQKNKCESWSQLGRGIFANWPIFAYLVVLMSMMNFSSRGTQDMFPTFMKSYRKMDPKVYSTVVMVMMSGAILGGVTFGFLSDRLGRRHMIMLAYAGGLIAAPFWAFSETTTSIMAAAFALQFWIQGAWGIVPAHINELSPDNVRGFLPGFAYQCGNLIAASIAWIQAKLAESHPYPNVMCTSAMLVFALAIIVTAVGRERRGVTFGAAQT